MAAISNDHAAYGVLEFLMECGYKALDASKIVSRRPSDPSIGTLHKFGDDTYLAEAVINRPGNSLILKLNFCVDNETKGIVPIVFQIPMKDSSSKGIEPMLLFEISVGNESEKIAVASKTPEIPIDVARIVQVLDEMQHANFRSATTPS